MLNSRLSLGLAIALVAGVACAKKEAATDTTAAMGASSAAMASQSPPVGGSATASPAGGLTDPNIVYILDQANAADSARGKLAETKGTNA